MNLRAVKVREDSGDTKKTVGELCTQFAILMDEVQHGFSVLEKKQKELERRVKLLESVPSE